MWNKLNSYQQKLFSRFLKNRFSFSCLTHFFCFPKVFKNHHHQGFFCCHRCFVYSRFFLSLSRKTNDSRFTILLMNAKKKVQNCFAGKEFQPKKTKTFCIDIYHHPVCSMLKNGKQITFLKKKVLKIFNVLFCFCCCLLS